MGRGYYPDAYHNGDFSRIHDPAGNIAFADAHVESVNWYTGSAFDTPGSEGYDLFKKHWRPNKR